MGSIDNSTVSSNFKTEEDQSRVIDGGQAEDHLRTSEVSTEIEIEGNDSQDSTLVTVEEHGNEQDSTQIMHNGVRYDEYSRGKHESTVGKRETETQICRTNSSLQSSNTLNGSVLSLCSVISSSPLQRPHESQITNISFPQQPEDFSEDQQINSSALIRGVLIPRYTFNQEITSHPGLGLSCPPVSYSQSLHSLETAHVNVRIQQILDRVVHRRNQSRRQVCYHRSYLDLDGPPCYICSMSDQPPKYKIKRSARQNANIKIMSVLQCLETLKIARSLQILNNGRSAGIIYSTAQNPNVALSGSTVPEMSLSETGEHGVYCIDYSPGVHHQTIISYQSNNTQASTSLESNPDSIHHSQDTHTPHISPASPVPTTHRTSSLCEVPPPYSPPNPRSLESGYFVQREQEQAHHQRENVTCIIRRFRCYTSMLYSIVYSVLLATITTILLLGHDQPVFVLASIVIFFTVFVFLPVIWCLKFVLRWKAGDLQMDDTTTERSIAIHFPLL
ncbi:uncharacterized protein [Procambarus clarkii]|uniref:uncharacterized protein n=1 Tax=Procambarus clarkii TaxID=6728 RepID=UPI001E674554|nr:uncharacterized protein LOC123746765 [Procambarus clarkii]